MKLQKKSNKKIIIPIILAVCLLLGFSYFYVHRASPPTSNKSSGGTSRINFNKPTKQQVQAGNDTKKQTVDSTQTTNTMPTQSIPVTITAANAANGTLSVRAFIDQIADQGTCTITLSSNGVSSVTETADIQALPSGSTCRGFDIPLDKLSASKTWNIQIIYNSGGSTGEANKGISI